MNREVFAAILADDKHNQKSKELLFQLSADAIAKAITHFAFRIGPVEDMHASPDSQLSDADMKVLNKFMHNRFTFVFECVKGERWAELASLVGLYGQYGSDWDPATPDDGNLREAMLMTLESTSG
jgi:hypothetical protein